MCAVRTRTERRKLIGRAPSFADRRIVRPLAHWGLAVDAQACPKAEACRGVMIDIALGDTSCDARALLEQVRRHIRACPHCQREFSAYRRVVALSTPPPVSDEEIEEIAANVRRRVLAKVGAQKRRASRARKAALIVAPLAVASLTLLVWSRTGERPVADQRGAMNTRMLTRERAIQERQGPGFAEVSVQNAPPSPSRVRDEPRDAVVPMGERRTSRRVALPPETPEGRRVQALGRLENELWRTVAAMRKQPNQDRLDDAHQAAVELRGIAESVPTTGEGRRARYLLFRFLQLLGETGQAESEFDAYVAGVRVGEGVEAARKALAEESVREKCAGNYELAYRRQQALLAFTAAGESAASAYIEMGHILTRAGRFREAEADFRRGIELQAPHSVARQAYMVLINAASARCDYQRALSDAQALQLLPGSEPEKVNDQVALAMVIERMEGPVKALPLYRQILTKHPTTPCAVATWRIKEIESRIERDLMSDPIEAKPR